MELNSVNHLNISNLKDSDFAQLKKIDTIELGLKNEPLTIAIDKIEIQVQNKHTTFSNSLINSINQISNSLTIQSTISEQLKITDKIEQSLNSVIFANSKQNINDIQPKIKNLMDNFNTLSSSISGLSNTNRNEEKSRIFFDGILGSKPLSSQEILAEIDSQKKRLEIVNKIANQEVLSNIQNSKDFIINEKQELQTQQPKLKNIDFEVESKTFDASKLQSIEGSTIETQANAKTEQSIKLLAS